MSNIHDFLKIRSSTKPQVEFKGRGGKRGVESCYGEGGELRKGELDVEHMVGGGRGGGEEKKGSLILLRGRGGGEKGQVNLVMGRGEKVNLT